MPTLRAMHAMKTNSSSALTLLVFGFALAACVERDPKGGSACNDSGDNGGANSAILVFHDGTGLQSRVEQTTRKDGSVVLRGDTTFAMTQQDKPATIIEHVEISPEGRLVYADVSALDANGNTSRRMLLDAAHGAVFVQDAKGAAWTRIEMDAPWLYTGLAGDTNEFELPVTAVSAWAALSAAKLGERIRMVDGSLRSSVTTTTDQIVVKNQFGEQIVVLGKGFATGDENGIRSLTLINEASTKTCNQC